LLFLLTGLLKLTARARTEDALDRTKLVVDALAGDEGSARRLVALLTPVVRSRAAGALMRRGRRAGRSIDQELADLTQEVLLCLFEQQGRRLLAWSAERGTLESFVGLVAEREVASIMRNGRRSPWKDEPSPDDEVERQQEPRKSDDDRVASRHLLERLLDRMRERLSPQGLQMFYALYVHEQSIEVVCEEMSMQPDAVYAWRSRLARLARTLAAEIEKDSDPLSGSVASARHIPRSAVTP
jgi:RNA polymerase sigma-70 factor (ECF subfamily)